MLSRAWIGQATSIRCGSLKGGPRIIVLRLLEGIYVVKDFGPTVIVIKSLKVTFFNTIRLIR